MKYFKNIQPCHVLGAIGALILLYTIGKLLYREAYENRPLGRAGEEQFVFIKRDSCPWCKKFQPTWGKLHGVIKKDKSMKSIQMFQMDPGQAKSNGFGNVEGVPTLKFKKKDGSIVEYSGQRTQGDILAWLRSIRA